MRMWQGYLLSAAFTIYNVWSLYNPTNPRGCQDLSRHNLANVTSTGDRNAQRALAGVFPLTSRQPAHGRPFLEAPNQLAPLPFWSSVIVRFLL